MSKEVIVRPYSAIEVREEIYPWINTPLAAVHAIEVEMDNAAFIYGSIVGLNKSIRKIADSVTPADSASLQTVLFSGLPSVLSGTPHQGIGKVENSTLASGVLFTASRNLVREPCLLFAISNELEVTDLPLVLRTGVGNAKDLPKILSVMGIKQAGGKRRRN